MVLKKVEKHNNSEKKTKCNNKKCINNKDYNSLDLFDNTTITPKTTKKLLCKNKLLKKLIYKVIPMIKKEIEVFIVPLVASNNGIYWTDYLYPYIEKFYKKEVDKLKNYLIVEIRFSNDLTIDLTMDI